MLLQMCNASPDVHRRLLVLRANSEPPDWIMYRLAFEETTERATLNLAPPSNTGARGTPLCRECGWRYVDMDQFRGSPQSRNLLLRRPQRRQPSGSNSTVILCTSLCSPRSSIWSASAKSPSPWKKQTLLPATNCSHHSWRLNEPAKNWTSIGGAAFTSSRLWRRVLCAVLIPTWCRGSTV